MTGDMDLNQTCMVAYVQSKDWGRGHGLRAGLVCFTVTAVSQDPKVLKKELKFCVLQQPANQEQDF